MFIGNQPITQAFITDTFSGTGTTTAFTMSVAPAGTTSVLVAVTGVVQDPSTYSVTGTTLTFSAAPPSGTGNISVRYLGVPASGVTTTAYRTVTEFTATANQTTFSIPSYTVGYINVYRNGVLLGSADYTATNGTTVVLAKGATAGDLVTTESFYVSSVLNALPSIGGTVNGQLNINSAASQAPLITSINGTEAMRVDTVGNILAGTTTSGLAGKIYVVNNVRIADANPETNAMLTTVSSTTSTIETRYNTPLLFGTNATERMRIDNAGNVGIGTTSPSVPIDIVSNSSAGIATRLRGRSSDNTAILEFTNNGASAETARMAVDTSGNIAFSNTSTVQERMRIDSSGNVLVAKTSTSSAVVGINLEAAGAVGATRDGDISYFANRLSSDGTTFSFRRQSTQVGSISVTTSATAYNTSSDYRLKENVTPMIGALDKVSQLNPVNWTWKSNGSEGQGFIAHELQAVVPDCVTGEKDAVDEEGNPVYQGIDTSFLVATLTKAIQEQQEIINELKTRIEALETK